MAETRIIHGRTPPPHRADYVRWLETELERRTQTEDGHLVQVTSGDFKGMLVYVDKAEDWGIDGRRLDGVPVRLSIGNYTVIGPIPIDPFTRGDDDEDVGIHFALRP